MKRPGFPEDDEDDYDFVRPPDPLPPIGKHEFYINFHRCMRGGDSHRHLLPWLPCHQPCNRFPGIDAAVQRIPKRDRPLEAADIAERKRLWGLVAMERVSTTRVAIWHLIILSGPFTFWFVYMCYIGERTDLQNASVPVTVVISLVSLFWVPQLSRR